MHRHRIDRRRSLAALSIVLALATPVARAQTMNWPTNDTERRIVDDAICVCGRDICGASPLSTCTCDFARRMRKEIKERLSKYALATAADRQRAAEEIRSWLVSRYGPGVFPTRDAPPGALAWIPPLLIAGGFVAVIAIGLRTVRRGRNRSNS